MKDLRCDGCDKKIESFEAHKCPICHKIMCENCTLLVSGVKFCSKYCSEYFFFGDGSADEQEPE